MNIYKKILMVSVCLVMAFSAVPAFAATLSVDAPDGAQTQFQVNITVDDSTGILGAAFTVEYDTTVLEVTDVSSSFFGTFQAQFIDSGVCTSCPTSAEGFGQPLVTNNVSGVGTRIAAARVTEDATSGSKTLFTLYFQFIGGTVGEVYPITIGATRLDNEDAGYSASGEDIDLLVGYDSGNDTYPAVLLSADYNAGTAASDSVENGGTGSAFSLDVDGNGTANGFQDGFIIARYMLGLGCSALTNNVLGDGATLTCEEIFSDLQDADAAGLLDVDANGTKNGFQDGFMFARYMLGLRCPALTNGVLPGDAGRTCEEIQTEISNLMP